MMEFVLSNVLSCSTKCLLEAGYGAVSRTQRISESGITSVSAFAGQLNLLRPQAFMNVIVAIPVEMLSTRPGHDWLS